MQRIITLLSLRPILFGLAGMIIGGLSFPLSGVIIVQNNLISMRYMLMHGVILGGTLSVVLGLPMLLCAIPVNILLVLIMERMNRKGKSLSVSGTAMMVSTMGLASLLSHVADVPAKDMLEVLWGSVFALTSLDLVLILSLALLTVLYTVIFFRPLSIIFFDSDTAEAFGVNVRVHRTVMLMLSALTVSVSMRVLGALLIDALLVLPVTAVSSRVQSLKELFIRSSLYGLMLSVSGYFIAILFNLPVSGTLALMAAGIYAFNSVFRRKR